MPDGVTPPGPSPAPGPRKRGRGRGNNAAGGRQDSKRHQSTVAGGTAPKRHASTTAASATVTSAKDIATNAVATDHLSDVTFDSVRGTLDQGLLVGIKFPLLTPIQAQTLGPALQGYDILAQAKTGTGKTLAFLLPAMQRVLTTRPDKRQRKGVSVLVLSPTRELAFQIAKQAEGLVAGTRGALTVGTAVGGDKANQRARDGERLAKQPPDVLVATPGRLCDLIDNQQGFAPHLNSIAIYILDEADRMLDMGFAPQLAKVKAVLPKHLQSMLFSATWTDKVLSTAEVRRDQYKFINTVPPEEQNVHKHVAQTYDVCGMPDLLPLALKHLRQERQRLPGRAKTIVFANTAMGAEVASDVLQFRKAEIGPVYEIHKRINQNARNKNFEAFRTAKEGVLVASDVAARGVDLPGVTLVLQLGAPQSSDDYIHRLGRTGRAGAEGRGVLILLEHERNFLKEKSIPDLPLNFAHTTQDATELAELRNTMHACMEQLRDDHDQKRNAYRAWLGLLKSDAKRWRLTIPQMVEMANAYAMNVLQYHDAEGHTVPPLANKTAGKMGLARVQGLRLVKDIPESSSRPWKGGA